MPVHGNASATVPNPLSTSAILDRGGSVFSVDAYSAVGDGVTLDDAAIASCLVAANAQSPLGSQIVFRPGKTYLHQAPITPFAGQVLVGYGATLKRPNQFSSTFSNTMTANVSNVFTGIPDTSGFKIGQSVGYLSGATYDTITYLVTGVTASTVTVATSVLTTVTGGTLFTAMAQIVAKFDHQAILGLTLDGNSTNNTVGASWHTTAEIFCSNNAMIGFAVRDCVLKNCACEGMILDGVGGTVIGNRILGAFGDGMHLAGCDRFRITHNHLFGTNTGNSQHGPQAAITYSALNPNCVVAWNDIDTTGTGIYDGTNAYGIALTISSGEDGGVCIGNVVRNTQNAAISWWGAGNQTAKAYEISGNRLYTQQASIGTASAPSAALAGSGAGNVDNGTHVYQVVFKTANGAALPSPSSAAVTVVDKTTNGQVTLTIPLGPTGTTSRDIYRSKANTTTPLFKVNSNANTVGNNTATTFTDNIADASLTTTNPPTSDTSAGMGVALLLGQVTSGTYPTGYTTLTCHDNYCEGVLQVQNLWRADVHDNVVNMPGKGASDQLGLKIGGSAGSRFHDNVIIGGFQGIVISGGALNVDLDVFNNTSIDGLAQGLVMSASNASSTRIHGNRIRGTNANINSGWSGIFINTGCNGIWVDGNDVETDQTAATPINIRGGGVSAGATGVICTGNQVRGGTAAITLAAGFNHVVTGNLITGTVSDASTASTVSGNTTIV